MGKQMILIICLVGSGVNYNNILDEHRAYNCPHIHTYYLLHSIAQYHIWVIFLFPLPAMNHI